MTSTTLAFDIIARDRASDKFDRVGNSAHRSTGMLKNFAKVGALAAAAGVVVLGRALVGAAKGAVEDEAAQKRLANALKNSAGATGKQVSATEAWISKQGVAKGVADDELRPALSKLALATHDVGKAQKLTSLAMNVSVGTHKTLAQVTDAFQKAQNGSVGGLSKLGVATKNADGSTKSFMQITKELAALHKGQAADAANSTEGKFRRLKVMYDETKESIGAKLIPVALVLADVLLNKVGPGAQKVGDWIMTNLVPPVKDFIVQMQTGEGVGGKFAAAFKTAGTTLGVLANFVNDNKAAVGTFLAVIGTVIAVTKTWAVVQAALNIVMTANPIGAVVVLVAALAGGLVYAYKKSETFRDIVDGSMVVVKKSFEAVGKAFGWVWDNAIKPVFKFITEKIQGVINIAASMLEALGKAPGMGWAKDAAEKLRAMADQGERAGKAVRDIPTSKTVTISFLYKGGGKLKGSPPQFGDDPNDPLMGTVNDRGFGAGASSPQSIGQAALAALAKGIKDGGKKAREALGSVRDSLKAKLDQIKGDMTSLSASVAAAFNKDVFGGNLSEMISGLQGNGAGLQQMLAAFDKLKAMGASSSFLKSLFQSGNTGLVNELVNSDAATVAGASGAFGANAAMALSLGDKVALDAIGPQVGQAVAAEVGKLKDEIRNAKGITKKEMREVFENLQLVVVGGNAGQKAYLMTGHH